MKRRDFILSSAGLAGSMMPVLGRAASPCPPPGFSVNGGPTTTTTCPSGGGSGSYSTNFDTTEFPISEGGAWHHLGNDWQNVRTSGGLAYTPNYQAGYDDAYAYLSGFGPDHEAWATVHKVSGYNPGTTHEAEILLRCSDTATTFRAYECQLRHSGYVQIVYLDGGVGTFTDITDTTTALNPVAGDVFRARIVGSNISCYLNNVLVATATHSVIKTGNPGIGFFMRSGATNTSFCWSSFSAVTL